MNLVEINNRFPTELDCVKYAEIVRWKGKPKCVYCKSKNIRRDNSGNRHRLHCRKCDRSFAVTVGTFLQGIRLPLRTWFITFSLIADAKKGISALQLQRNINISYPTAWKMYHAIREIMDYENSDTQLTEIVEMDETYTGGKPRKYVTGKNEPPKNPIRIPSLDRRIKELKEAGVIFKKGRGNPARPDLHPKRGRGTSRPKIVGIVQRDGKVIAEVMKTLGYKNLKKMVDKYVDKDRSVLITDELRDYNKMNNIIEHLEINHKKLYSYKGVNTNTIESFWAIIKRQIIGQHHHVSIKYLPKYVAETVFKFNNRKNDYMFYTLLQNALKSIN